MSTSGNLELFPFSEFLQALASLAKTGKLTLSRQNEKGIVLLRKGNIIHAATSSIRETLGSLLVGEELITEAQLNEALEAQRESEQEVRLGNILVDREILSQRDLERVIMQQTQRVILELMQWRRGLFEFVPLEIEDHGEVATEVAGLLLQDGLSTEGILITGAIELDRLAFKDDQSGAEMPDLSTGEPTPALALSPTAKNGGTAARVMSLSDLMLEIRSPEFTGELTSRIMEYASQLFNRSVLFSVKGDYFCGMGSFGAGLEDGSAAAVRQIRIPVAVSSILQKVADQGTAYKGPMPESEWNQRLIEELGGPRPEEVVAVPLIVDSRTVLVLYGDSAPDNTRIQSIESLELLAHEVGLAMEKDVVGDPLDPASERLDASHVLRHDPLTGLLNREAMLERVAKTLRRSLLEDDALFAVLVLDIDGFKLYNASLGWAAGSELLCAVGDRLSQNLRPTDVVGRLGANQFCILLQRISHRAEATLVSQRIIDSLGEPIEVAGTEISVSIRIGIAIYEPAYTEADHMITEAEAASMRAKTDPGSSLQICEATLDGSD